MLYNIAYTVADANACRVDDNSSRRYMCVIARGYMSPCFATSLNIAFGDRCTVVACVTRYLNHIFAATLESLFGLDVENTIC